MYIDEKLLMYQNYTFSLLCLVAFIIPGMAFSQSKGFRAGDTFNPGNSISLPNPTSDHWAGQPLAEPQPEYLSGCMGEQLKLPDPTDAITAKVKFMDMSGRLIWSGPIYLSGRFDFDLATLPPGIYLKVITTLCNYPLHSEKIAIIH